MSRSQTDRRSGALSVAVLVAATALAAWGGVTHVFYKNRQIRVQREIERVQNRIAQHHDEIRTMRMEMDRGLNCFAIGEQLERHGSKLRPIHPDVIENIRESEPPGRVMMATTHP